MTPRHPQLSTSEVLDGLSLAVIGLDQSLCVDRMNPAAEVLFGVSARYASGEPIGQAVPLLADREELFRQALRAGEAFTQRDLKLRGSDGRQLTIDLSVTPIRSAGQRALLLEIVARDRQLRISRDDSLWQQQQVSREMVRGLAHEIKNPLGGLRGAAQLLARELPSAHLAEYTDIIIREADRLQQLVDRLLGPSRLPDKRELNIHEVVEHVRRLMAAQAPPGVSILRDYDPSLPSVVGDRQQLIQALLNIGVNALEAVADRGKISLRTRSQRQFTIGGCKHRLVLRIDVSDDGPGVAPDMLERMFYPMVSTRPEGSGLGLAIAQNLVHYHQGLIECDSAPGATTFSIYLPVEPCHDT